MLPGDKWRTLKVKGCKGVLCCMFSFTHIGSYNKLEKFLNAVTNRSYLNKLDAYGKMGVAALSAATPVDTGLTASSWTYEIEHNGKTTSISWLNTNKNNGVNVAIILQYGHGTGTGGYVRGRDYINPAIQPVFDRIAQEVGREVS